MRVGDLDLSHSIKDKKKAKNKKQTVNERESDKRGSAQTGLHSFRGARSPLRCSPCSAAMEYCDRSRAPCCSRSPWPAFAFPASLSSCLLRLSLLFFVLFFFRRCADSVSGLLRGLSFLPLFFAFHYSTPRFTPTVQMKKLSRNASLCAAGGIDFAALSIHHTIFAK